MIQAPHRPSRATALLQLRLLVLVLLASCSAFFPSGDASACALMPVGTSAAPNLSAERVLIVYDRARRLEHFVREVRFDGASGTFTFVVPTPTQPELAAVDEPPFDALSRDFPIEPPPEPEPMPEGAKSAAPQAVAAVQVLSVQQVGKFKAFVLAAKDATALQKWLTDERITLPPGGQAWLSHYVGLGFYFSAFRYDADAAKPADPNAPPPAPGDAPTRTVHLGDAQPSLTSQTVRLSFSTPLPYFPYLEPVRVAERTGAPHEMQVWLVSDQLREPRLRRAVNGQPTRWGWAWETGVAYERRPSEIARSLGPLGKLLPDGERMQVQTFRDRRVNRNGWSDVVLPPAESELDESSSTSIFASLLGNLDRLIHLGTLEPSELANEDKMRAPPSARGCACGLPRAAAGASGGWLAAAALALAVIRRRRRRAATLRTVLGDARLPASARRVRPRPLG